MLTFDMIAVGNRLLASRKRLGLTQAQAAELAGLSDRTYADIERGTVNMRMGTFLNICNALKVLPNEVLLDTNNSELSQHKWVLEQIEQCTPSQRDTALQLLSVYLQSLNGAD